jgi:excisionase family DNA binding protein
MTDEENTAEPTVTVSEAALLLGMAESTVYDWVKEGTLPSVVRSGMKMVLRSVLRKTKLLREVDVLAHPDAKAAAVTESDAARAVNAGAARPSESPRKYSLDDIDAIIAFKRGAWVPPATPTPAVAPPLTRDAPRVVPPRSVPTVADSDRSQRGPADEPVRQHDEGLPCDFDTPVSPSREPPRYMRRTSRPASSTSLLSRRARRARCSVRSEEHPGRTSASPTHSRPGTARSARSTRAAWRCRACRAREMCRSRYRRWRARPSVR